LRSEPLTKHGQRSESDILLDVEGLTAELDGVTPPRLLLNDVWLRVGKGEIVGLVGETGAGKSLTAWAILGLVNPRIKITTGSVRFRERDLRTLGTRELEAVRGREIALIVQNPGSALDPMRTVGFQLTNLCRVHSSASRAEAFDRAHDALANVGLPRQVFAAYPHELSGGMAQRVVIAMGLINRAALLIADEPTTGLDVTVQADILDLLRHLVDTQGLAVVLVTHDLGVVANYCDRVAVMYAGRVVEASLVDVLFREPEHPYTRSLIQSANGDTADETLDIGPIPDANEWLSHCAYASRCDFARDVCHAAPPATEMVAPDHGLLCYRPWRADDGPA
jgi:peptide/nickel transport system ATP-binding protein